MGKADPKALMHSLRQFAEFVIALGEDNRPAEARIADLVHRLEHEGVNKPLLAEIERTNAETLLATREQVFAGRTVAGMDSDQALHELNTRSGAVFLVLYPIDPLAAEIDISDFAGAEHVEYKFVMPRGDPAGARLVVERTIDLVCRYAELIGRGDFRSAYGMTDPALRERMDLDSFIAIHCDGEKEFGGPALEFVIERFAYVLTDDAARRQSNTSKEGWLKGTSKPDRRARVIGFWVRNAAQRSGCRGSIWITEHDAEYRVANFNFYRD